MNNMVLQNDCNSKKLTLKWLYFRNEDFKFKTYNNDLLDFP